MNSSLLIQVFSLTQVFGTDLLWISELFFFGTRTARIAYAPTLPPFGPQSGGRRFRKKEPERRGKAVVLIDCRKSIYILMKEKPVQRTDFSLQNSDFIILTACLISFGNRSI